MADIVTSPANRASEERAFVRQFNFGLALAVSIWALLFVGTVIA